MSTLPAVARASLRRAGATRAVVLAQRHALTAGLVAVLLAGGWLRWDGANWDDGGHLHPDERYVTIVADNVHWPGLLEGYFDVERSPLSPYNTEPGRAYVYGTFPLYATKAVGALLGRNGYELNIVGRHLSALLDTGTIVLVFLIGLLLLGELGRAWANAGALLAAASYAFSVAAIQNSHYFTTDSWLVFFGMLTFYLAARSVSSGVEPGSGRFLRIFVLVGGSFGLTVACKVSGAFLALPVLLAVLGRCALVVRRAGTREAILRFCLSGLTIVVSAYATFRAVSPYAFANSSWLDLTVSPDFRSALEAQRRAVDGAFLYPPAYQWLLSPRLWDPLVNLIVWQLGVPLGLAALGGVGVLLARTGGPVAAVVLRRGGRDGRTSPGRTEALTQHAMLVAFVLVVFFWVASRFSHTGRYLLPVLPLLSVAAAYGLVALAGGRRQLLSAFSGLVVVASALYALAFHHVYAEQNTRMAASDWIVANVEPGLDDRERALGRPAARRRAGVGVQGRHAARLRPRRRRQAAEALRRPRWSRRLHPELPPRVADDRPATWTGSP